jgi:hypothetical protein
MRQVTVTEKYRAVNEGQMDKQEFVRQMRLAFPSLINQFNGYDDSVSILRTKGLLFEEKTMKHDVSDESIRRALDAEITVLGQDPVTCTDSDVIDKARTKAIANLSKDPLYYYNLLSNESSKVDKNDQPKETKRGALEKDTFNDMKKATLKERKENLVEGTRALVGYLAGDTLTTTYNHHDGYPSNLGAGLEAHYNDDEKAKDIAMKGYITYLDPETGETESTHKDPAQKIKLPSEDEDMAREIADAINSMGADFGYIWDDRSNRWITIKNTGTRSMIDQISSKLGDYADLQELGLEEIDIEEIDSSLDPYEDKKIIIQQVIDLLKTEKGAGNEVIKDFIKTHYEDIINLRDDQAILDEFEEFLSVNTDYVDEDKRSILQDAIDAITSKYGGIHGLTGQIKSFLEMHSQDIIDGADPVEEFNNYIDINFDSLDETDAYDNDEETQDMIDKMRKDGKDADDFVDEEYEPGSIAPEDLYYSDKHGRLVTMDDVDDKYHDSLELVYSKGDKIEGPMDEKKGTDHDGEIISFIADTYIQNAKDGDSNYAGFLDLNIRDAVQDVVGILQDPKHPLHAETKKEYAIVEKDKARGLFEKKGTDHDKDGDIDGDDYKHAKDKAIKKAMGKDEGMTKALRENVKAIITKVLEEDQINEAATNVLAAFGEEYAGFDGMKQAINQLENIVTDIEQYYDKTRSKIQKIYDTLGEIRNEEGLKVGGFLAPAVEQAFNRDLRPVIKQGFTSGLNQPKVKTISSAEIAAARERGEIDEFTEEAPKKSVFTPVYESKKKK